MKIVHYKNTDTGRLSTVSYKYFVNKYNDLFKMANIQILSIENVTE